MLLFVCDLDFKFYLNKMLLIRFCQFLKLLVIDSINNKFIALSTRLSLPGLFHFLMLLVIIFCFNFMLLETVIVEQSFDRLSKYYLLVKYFKLCYYLDC